VGGREGQTLVEFALILPVLILLLVGLMEFALLLYNQHVITNASREGARYGIVSRTDRRTLTEIETVVNQYCLDNLVTFGDGTPETDILVTDTLGTIKATSSASFSDNLQVSVEFEYQFLVLPNFITSFAWNRVLHAETTMKYE
jgi:Flp pilus assembly protein TadG